MCHFGVISKPLTELLRKGSIFTWIDIQEQAFQALKQALISALVLVLPDFRKSFVVEMDASGHGVGAILMQGGIHLHTLVRPWVHARWGC